MATDPISGARYALETDSGDVALWMQRGVNDLSSQVVPRFTTTTARDNAYSAAITAGTITSIPNGALCIANGVPYRRINGNWRENRQRIFFRNAQPSVTIASGGAAQTGVTSGIAALGSFTLYEASRVMFHAVFRTGPDVSGSGAALCYIVIDNSASSLPTMQRAPDDSVAVIAGVDLAAGSHSIGFRVEAFGGSCSWVSANMTFMEGAVE